MADLDDGSDSPSDLKRLRQLTVSAGAVVLVPFGRFDPKKSPFASVILPLRRPWDVPLQALIDQ